MKFSKLFFSISILILGFGFFGVAHASTLTTDTFDSYTTGTDLNGQGGWNTAGASNCKPETGTVYAGTKAINCQNTVTYNTFTPLTDGTQTMYLNLSDTSASATFQAKESGTGGGMLGTATTSAGFKYLDSSCAPVAVGGAMTAGTWYGIEYEWRSSDHKVRYTVGSTTTAWVDSCGPWSTNIDEITFSSTNAGHPVYFDSLQATLDPLTPTMSITTPASGTTQTSSGTTLTVSWSGFGTVIDGSEDGGLDHNILLNFTQDTTGEQSATITHHLLSTEASGSFSVTLNDFHFKTNGFQDADLAVQNIDPLSSTFGALSDNFEPTYYIDLDYSSLPVAPATLTETCTDITIAGGSIDLGTWADLPCQLHNAFAWVFSDNPAELKSLFTKLQTDSSNMWPIGYITRLVTIFRTTTAVEPPALSYTLGTSITDHTDLSGTYTFQVFDHLDTINSVTEDTGAGTRNIWDIFMPYWNTVIYLSLFIVIITTLMNAHLGHILQGGHHSSKQRDAGDHPKSEK